jgi:RND family efflux transporter MFP subunit
MKKLRPILIILAIAGAMGFILVRNKKEIDKRSQVKEEAKSVSVTVASVGFQNLSENLSMIGTFAPARELKLLSEVQGKVIRVGVEEGDRVKQGQLIAQVDNELIRAELTAAEAAHEQARKNVTRFEALLKGNAATEAQVEDTRLALKNAEARVAVLRKQLKNTTITAPISGTVVSRSFEQGSVLMPGAQLVEIIDISRLKLVINVPEKDIFKYKEGNKIGIRTDIYPGAELNGTVTMTGVKADAARNYPVQILVENKGKYPLRAGMYGRASGDNAVKDSVLAIPRTALTGSVKNPQVYVVQDGKATLKAVQTGVTTGSDIEVISGLSAGDQVVISGQINLEDGSPVTVVQ